MLNKKIIAAALLLTLTLTACGKTDDSDSEDKADNVSSYESDSEKDSVKDNTDTDSSDETGKKYSVDYEQEENEGLSAEESMRIEELKRSVKADEDGFIIKDDILYDYDGVHAEVHIPDGVKKIESSAFWSNDVVEAVFIPGSVEEIGSNAFWSCDGLKFVSAEEGLKVIKDGAFWSCSGLTDVNLPESVEKISSSVFWSIGDLTIHAPAGSYATSFAEYLGCGYSEEYAEYVKSDRANLIRAAQYEYGDFSEFTIPENIKGIDATAFQYCKNLEGITIPGNVEYVASRAFEYCYKLSVVKIEDGCQKIGDSAFAYCENLSDVYLPESLSDISKRAFEYCADDLTLHVPKDSYAEEYAMAMNIPFDNDMG